MGLGCGISMIKYILFVFNLVCALCGIAIIAIGVTIHLQLDDFKENFHDINLTLTPILFIALGAVIFVIAFFGCCGAINESRCMTATYSSFLLIILIAQIVLGVFIFMNIDVAKQYSKKVVNNMWTDRENQMQFWDKIQPALECCGINGPLDWGIAAPKSCCANDVPVCTIVSSYSKGCADVFSEVIGTSSLRIAYVALGVAAVELLGVIFACCLVNSIRNQERRYA